MNFFHHKDLGNHLLQLCPKVVKHPVFTLLVLYKVFEPNGRYTLKMDSNIHEGFTDPN